MSELEELVPPPDMCKKIPRGYFKDSALVYVLMGEPGGGEGFEQWWELFPRRDRPAEPSLPAPTAEEISEELSNYGNIFMSRDDDGWRLMFETPGDAERYGYDAKIERNTHHPASAALRLWFEVTKNCNSCASNKHREDENAGKTEIS